MKKFNNKSGFTLIEIIVVLIIIGILAAIALPNLFNNVQTAQGGSALQSAAQMETPIESCVNKNSSTLPGVGPCGLNTVVSTGTSLTTATAANNFVIEVENGAGSASAGTLTYELVGEDGGSVKAFTLERASTGVFTCSPGTAPYTQVC